MPQNCSADVQAVVAYIDEVFMGNNQSAIDELKANWGLGDVVHLDDVASACKCLELSLLRHGLVFAPFLCPM